MLVCLCSVRCFSCSYVPRAGYTSLPCLSCFKLHLPLVQPPLYSIPTTYFIFFPSKFRTPCCLHYLLFILFFDISRMLPVPKNLEIVFLPPAVHSSPQNSVPSLSVKSGSSMVFMNTAPSSNTCFEFGSKKLAPSPLSLFLNIGICFCLRL